MANLTRAVVATQIGRRLTGDLGDGALAAWAFQQFYAVEMGRCELEAGAELLLTSTLDLLMFADNPGFYLDEAELRALLLRLEEA